MDQKELRLEIMKLRIEKGMNQKEFGEKIGVSQRSVSMWENGEAVPRNTTCIKIAKSFDLPLDYFLLTDENGVDAKKESENKIEEFAPDPGVEEAVEKLLDYYGDTETLIRKIRNMYGR